MQTPADFDIHATGAPLLAPTGMQRRRAVYFYRLKDDNLVAEFCIGGSGDVPVSVETPIPDGQGGFVLNAWGHRAMQPWPKRWEGDLLVFTPPSGYDGGPVALLYDRRLLVVEAADRGEMEKLALRNRISFDLGAA